MIKKNAAPINTRDKLLLGFAVFVAICLFAVASFAALNKTASVNCIDAQDPKICLRVLFIGNSYTYTNNLPGMFAELARSGGHEVETGMVAEGGWIFSQHVNSSKTLDKLKSPKWDFVILQEQSEIPANEKSRMNSMYPSARLLVRQIREVTSAAPIFFLTWAHRNGWPDGGVPGYEAMQSQLDYGYQQIAQELQVPIAPAGFAWLRAMRQDPQLDLWQPDGSHPNEQGTYLAACVFYAVIFHQSPEGLTYTAHLPQDTSRTLQTIAANVVLQNPQPWNLP